MEYSVENIDIEKLRKYIEEYYMNAYFCGIDSIIGELAYVQTISDEKLIQYAISTNINLNDFLKTRGITQ